MIGRIRGTAAVVAMVEREDYCPDVMKQVAALQASLERVNRLLLENHLETCVTEAINVVCQTYRGRLRRSTFTAPGRRDGSADAFGPRLHH